MEDNQTLLMLVLKQHYRDKPKVLDDALLVIKDYSKKECCDEFDYDKTLHVLQEMMDDLPANILLYFLTMVPLPKIQGSCNKDGNERGRGEGRGHLLNNNNKSLLLDIIKKSQTPICENIRPILIDYLNRNIPSFNSSAATTMTFSSSLSSSSPSVNVPHQHHHQQQQQPQQQELLLRPPPPLVPINVAGGGVIKKQQQSSTKTEFSSVSNGANEEENEEVRNKKPMLNVHELSTTTTTSSSNEEDCCFAKPKLKQRACLNNNSTTSSSNLNLNPNCNSLLDICMQYIVKNQTQLQKTYKRNKSQAWKLVYDNVYQSDEINLNKCYEVIRDINKKEKWLRAIENDEIPHDVLAELFGEGELFVQECNLVDENLNDDPFIVTPILKQALDYYVKHC